MSPPCFDQHHFDEGSPSYDHLYFNDYRSLAAALNTMADNQQAGCNRLLHQEQQRPLRPRHQQQLEQSQQEPQHLRLDQEVYQPQLQHRRFQSQHQDPLQQQHHHGKRQRNDANTSSPNDRSGSDRKRSRQMMTNTTGSPPRGSTLNNRIGVAGGRNHLTFSSMISATMMITLITISYLPSCVTGISGLVYTKSGYDNPSGSDPICWSAPSFHNETALHEHEQGHDGHDEHDDHGESHDVVDHDEQDVGEGHSHADNDGEVDHGDEEEHANQVVDNNTTIAVVDGDNATAISPSNNITNSNSSAVNGGAAVRSTNLDSNHDDGHGHGGSHSNTVDGMEENLDLLQDFAGKVWESHLFPDFVAGPVTMEVECPPLIKLHVDVPHEYVEGEILRTDRVYHYHVELEFDLDELRTHYGLSSDAHVVSESGESIFSLQMKMCEVNGNFCTPFVERHDHSEHDSHDDDDHSDHESDDNGHGHASHDEDEHDSHDDNGHDAHDNLNHDAHDTGHDAHDAEEEDNHDHDHDHRRRLYLRKTGQSQSSVTKGSNRRRLQKHLPDIIQGDLLQEYLAFHDDDDSHAHASHDSHGHEDAFVVDAAVLESPTVLIPVDEGQSLVHMDLDIPVDLHVPGVFLPLVTMQLFLSNATVHGHAPGIDEIAAFKVDIANALHQRSLIYQAPAKIRTVSLLAAVSSYVLVAACSIFGMWLLCMVFKNRKEKIMILSQGTFLAIFQAAGILATICCVLFEPKSDTFCYLSGPLVILPMQFMLAILFGRLRRIITVMSPIMSVGTNSVSTLSNGKPDNNRNKTFRRHLSSGVKKTKKLRQEFTAWRSWRVIIIFTLPQILLQILHEAVYPPHLTLILNVDGSIGRHQCGDDISQWIQFGELLCVYVGLIVLVIESQRSQKLPALFNEASSISQASVGTIFIATAGLMIVVFSRDPTSNPDVRYIMLVFVVLAFVVNLSIRLVVPKLQLIWKGEKVVVSRILREHRQSKLLSMQSGNSSFGTNFASSAFPKPKLKPDDLGEKVTVSPSSEKPALGFQKDEYMVPLKSPIKAISWTGMVDIATPASALSSALTPGESEVAGVDDSIIASDALPPPPLTDTVPHPPECEGTVTRRQRAVSSSLQESQSSESTDLLITNGVAPPSKVTLAINEQAALLSRINDRILSGLEVPQRDWEELRTSFGDMHHFFHQLKYAWESNDKGA